MVNSISNTERMIVPRVLAVSFSYPPQTEPRAIQVSRLLKHLNAATVLVCEGQPAEVNNGKSTNRENEESFLEAVLRVPFKNPLWRKPLNVISDRVKLPVWSRTPDPLVPWKKPVVKAIQRFVSEQDYRPDVLVTFAFPLIDNIIGLELKQHFGFPWLAHFSDPWVDSPFKSDDRWTRAINTRLERSVVENCDRLVFTSGETAELVMSKYPSALQAKVRIVPHAYESELFPGSQNTHQDRMVVRYLGDLYLVRTPRPLFQALEVLAKTEPDLLREVCFEIVGEVHQLDLEEMGLSRLPKGLVVFRPRVSYRKSLELMTSAAGLMVIDAPVEGNQKSVFLPSKLIEYVGAGRPIIGLTPPGTAADLIERLGGWVADPGNVNQVAEVLRRFLLFLREQRQEPSRIWGRPEVRGEFEAKTVATKFEQVFLEIACGNSGTKHTAA